MKLGIKEKELLVESLRYSSSKLNNKTAKYEEIKLLIIKLDMEIKYKTGKLEIINKGKTEKYKNRVQAIEDYLLNKLTQLKTIHDIDEIFTYENLANLINVSNRTIRTYMRENQDLKDLYKEYQEYIKDKKQIILFKRVKEKYPMIKSFAKLHEKYLDNYYNNFGILNKTKISHEKARKYSIFFDK